MKKILVALICLLPFKLPNLLLRLLGYKIASSAKIGFSILLTNDINLGENTRIGKFNLIKIDELNLEESSYIGHMNLIKGPFKILLKKRGAIGNRNLIRRAFLGVTYGESVLTMGELSKITSEHYIDLTRSITFGDFSTLAGIRSQIWTHGYVHEKTGAGRIRVDGEIKVGNNVYIGSSCIFNPGITIGKAISIGSGSILSKDLVEEGMYINQPMRMIEHDVEIVKQKLKKLQDNNILDEVYLKN